MWTRQRELPFEAGAAIGGYDCSNASLTDEADPIQLLRKLRPPTLMAACRSGDQDGYDLIRQVRDLGHSPENLPAEALTAFAHKHAGHSREAISFLKST